ncbi:MAG: AAA family ATPase, partial [Ruminococcus sp.]|nr:AAA family ATPase [Ruminococcus sp.]
IPYGKLTLLEGDPGEGKSTFMLHIAALITQGQDMPDGYKVEKAEYVIYQCNEDDVADTIKPRLQSAGADCSKVAYIIDDNSSLTLNDQRITQVLEKTHARLLILDPFQSFLMQDGDLHSVGRMRTTLGNLAVIASRYRCAVVLIGHMNKSATGKSLYRGLGSIDIAAIARSVLMVTRDEDDPEIRYMIPIKSSLAPEGPEVAFRMNRTIGFQWLKNKNKNHKKHFKKSDVADNLLSLRKSMQGVIPGISRDIILSMPIPLPPLAEQHRIVSKIEEIMPFINTISK